MSRKRTVFDLCDTHAGLTGDRRRLAEIFCEGGPGFGSPCHPQLCQIRPGTDLFCADVTDDQAAQWVLDWAVNENAHR